MKTKNTYAIFLTFTFLFSHAFSMGHGSGSNAPKAVPEVVETDASCDEAFFENFQSKKNCLSFSDNFSCAALAMGAVAGVGGAAAYSSKTYEVLIKKQSPDVQKKFIEAIKYNRIEKAMNLKASQIFEDIKDKKVKEISKGKFQNFKEFEKARIFGPNSEYQAALKLFNEINIATDSEFKSLTLSEKNSDLRNAMNSIDEPYSQKMRSQRARVTSKIGLLFPEEYKKLKPFYDQFEPLQKKMRDLSIAEPINYSEVESVNERTKQLFENIKSLAKNNPKVGLVNSLMREALMSPSKDWTKGVFKLARELSAKETSIRANKSAIKTGIAGTAFSTIAMAIDGLMGQADIRACKSAFQLSESEIDYLGNGSILTAAKAAKSDSWSCESMALIDPSGAYQDMTNKFGGVPKGICRLAKQQESRLDNLTGEFASNPNASCTAFSDINLTLNKEIDSGKDQFQFKSDGKIYSAPFSFDMDYPELKYMKVLDESGKEDRNESLKIQRFYNEIHPANKPDPRPDINDLASSCAENSSNGKLFCHIKQAAVRARIAKSISRSVCAFSNIAQGAKSSDSPVKAGNGIN